jgi:hypothetical protein
MLAELFAPVTPDNFNVLLDQRAVFVIDGILFRPATNDAGRPVWHGANGITVRLGDMDDVFDDAMDRGVRVSYLLDR